MDKSGGFLLMSSFFFFFFCAEFRPIRPLIDVLWQSRCRRRDAAKVWDVACVHVSAPRKDESLQYGGGAVRRAPESAKKKG